MSVGVPQYDSRGRNFLHAAIEKKDIESVMFLLSIHVNVHSRTRDSLSLTPLQLAAQADSEIILRSADCAGHTQGSAHAILRPGGRAGHALEFYNVH